MSKFVKYLANKIKVFERSGEISEYDLSIVTIEFEMNSIKSFSIRPFLFEEPAVTYLDTPLEIHCGQEEIITNL